MESDSEEAHHLLVMDLESSFDCCNLLITNINAKLMDLKRKADGSLTATARAKLALSDSTMEQASKMLERQISAINLLLTACNARTLADQHKILKRSRSRKAFQRVQEDSASLKAHRDTTSLLTSYTDNLSKQSMVFDFDSELFATKIYAPMILNRLKVPLRFRPRRVYCPPATSDVNLERPLAADDLAPKQPLKGNRNVQEVKILLTGESPVRCLQYLLIVKPRSWGLLQKYVLEAATDDTQHWFQLL